MSPAMADRGWCRGESGIWRSMSLTPRLGLCHSEGPKVQGVIKAFTTVHHQAVVETSSTFRQAE